MKRIRATEGSLSQCESPIWEPLEEVIAKYVTGPFMWMGEVELANGTRLQAYKHGHTRNYVHLGPDGEAYLYSDERYLEADVAEELAVALHINRQLLLGGDGSIGCPRASLRLRRPAETIEWPQGPGAFLGPLTDRIELASIIAEELVEQTSSASCNWPRVVSVARELADLAASVIDSIGQDRAAEVGGESS